MTTLTDWSSLPDDVRWELWDHYCRLEYGIWVDRYVAGINSIENDYNDDDWSRYFNFDTEDELDLFLSMAGFENHPSGEAWEIEDHEAENIRLSASDIDPSQLNDEAGFTICIPRLDLYIVGRNLKRLNAIMVDDYEQKWRAAWNENFSPPVEA